MRSVAQLKRGWSKNVTDAKLFFARAGQHVSFMLEFSFCVLVNVIQHLQTLQSICIYIIMEDFNYPDVDVNGEGSNVLPYMFEPEVKDCDTGHSGEESDDSTDEDENYIVNVNQERIGLVSLCLITIYFYFLLG